MKLCIWVCSSGFCQCKLNQHSVSPSHLSLLFVLLPPTAPWALPSSLLAIQRHTTGNIHSSCPSTAFSPWRPPISHPSASSILQGTLTCCWRRATSQGSDEIQEEVLNWLTLIIKKKWSCEWLLREEEDSQLPSTVLHLSYSWDDLQAAFVMIVYVNEIRVWSSRFHLHTSFCF